MRSEIILQLTAAIFGLAALAATAGGGVAAEQNAPDASRPELLQRLQIPPAPVVPPEDSLEKIKVAPGFRVELVAAEPMIHDPVAMRFDAQGRLWVVEMRSYMPNPEGTGQQKPTSRVVVLRDQDGDGRMDDSTVFLETSPPRRGHGPRAGATPRPP